MNFIGWYERSRRDLPWREPGRQRVADPGQRIHAATDAGGPGAADLAGLGATLAHPVGHRRGQRGRRAARLGQAGLSEAGQALARMRDRHRARSRRRRSRRRRNPADACPVSAATPRVPWRASPTASRYRWWTPMCDGWWPAPCTAWPTPVAPSATRDHADVSALLPTRRNGAAVFGSPDGTGCDGVHRAHAAMRVVPARASARGGMPAIPRRRGRRAAFRPTPEPTVRSAVGCWMSCASTILRSPGPSWTWRG